MSKNKVDFFYKLGKKEKISLRLLNLTINKYKITRSKINLRETGSLLDHLGATKTYLVQNYFLNYITKNMPGCETNLHFSFFFSQRRYNNTVAVISILRSFN